MEVLEELEKTLEQIRRKSIELMMKTCGWSEEKAWQEWNRLYAECYLDRLARKWNQKGE